MPSAITDPKKFLMLAKRDSTTELRVKRIGKGQYRGHVKLKLRTAKYLYTMTFRDPAQAKKMAKELSSHVSIVRV